jgi:hypothetical protein
MNTSWCSVCKQDSPCQFVEFMPRHVCGNGVVHCLACDYHNTVTHACDSSQGSVNVMYIFNPLPSNMVS